MPISNMLFVNIQRSVDICKKNMSLRGSIPASLRKRFQLKMERGEGISGQKHLEQIQGSGAGDGLSAALDLELAVDGIEVRFDGTDRYDKLPGDLMIRLPFTH
jgi:hypothetical protein